ncbi:MAG: hypothetical protein ACYTBV_15000, partial [Planctomycetota bacterium]
MGPWYPGYSTDANATNTINISGDAEVTTTGEFKPGNGLAALPNSSETWFTERRILNTNVTDDATWNVYRLLSNRNKSTITIDSNAFVNCTNRLRLDARPGVPDTIHIKGNGRLDVLNYVRSGDADYSWSRFILDDNATFNIPNNHMFFKDNGWGELWVNDNATLICSGRLDWRCLGQTPHKNLYRITGGYVEYGDGFWMNNASSTGIQKALIVGGETVFGADENSNNQFRAPRIGGGGNVCYISLSGGILNMGYLTRYFEIGTRDYLVIDVNDVHGGGMMLLGPDESSYTELSSSTLNTPLITDSNNALRFKYVGPSPALGVTYYGISPKRKAWGPWPFDKYRDSAESVKLSWQVADIIEDTDSQKVYIATDKAIIDAIAAGAAGEAATYGKDANSHTATGLLFLNVQYWRVDSNDSGNWTKGDVWRFGAPGLGKAYDPYPANNSKASDLDLTLRWRPSPYPSYLLNQNVYYGTNATEVTDANTSTAGVFQGEYPAGANSLPIGTLDIGVSRWWRVDSNMSIGGIIKGDTWKFTMDNFYTIEDFDWYGGTTNLRATWLDY